MRKNKIAHQELFSAAAEMAQGLIDADLSGHVVKKRVAVGGRGRRSGARTIVATNFGNKWISNSLTGLRRFGFIYQMRESNMS